MGNDPVETVDGLVDEQLLRQELKQYHWYHTIPLTPNVSTPGWPVVVPIVDMTVRSLSKVDFVGKRVLDIGCRDGLFSLEAERRGASEVIGIDNDLTVGAPEFLKRFFDSKIKLVSFNLFDLRPSSFGSFDVVIFAGVLYHLRYPFYSFRLVKSVLGPSGILVLETAVLVDDNRHALMFCPVGAESPYEPTSCTFFNLKGLTDTLSSLGFEVLHQECLMNLKHKAETALPDKPAIDRATLICRKRDDTNKSATDIYWDGQIDMHCFPHWDCS